MVAPMDDLEAVLKAVWLECGLENQKVAKKVGYSDEKAYY